MQTLNGSGLKLWLYLNKNQDNYRMELSRVDCAKWGIKKDSYYSAVDELIKKGFLVQDHSGSNLFWFHEKAVSVEAISLSGNSNQKCQNSKKVSENPERNITNNTEIIQNNTNNTIDDDIAKGDIVDCGKAAIQKKTVRGRDVKEWLGNGKFEKVYESPNVLLNKYDF